jgi:hypothetical protein
MRWCRKGAAPFAPQYRAALSSELRLCRYLNVNALTGSVPSSLAMLTRLGELCVPSRAHCVSARPYASDRSAPRQARRGAVEGACRGIKWGQGRCGLLCSTGARARFSRVSKWYQEGWVLLLPFDGSGEVALTGVRCGGFSCSVCAAVLRGMAECASSNLQLPQRQRADRECAEFALRAHKS